MGLWEKFWQSKSTFRFRILGNMDGYSGLRWDTDKILNVGSLRASKFLIPVVVFLWPSNCEPEVTAKIFKNMPFLADEAHWALQI